MLIITVSSMKPERCVNSFGERNTHRYPREFTLGRECLFEHFATVLPSLLRPERRSAIADFGPFFPVDKLYRCLAGVVSRSVGGWSERWPGGTTGRVSADF